jgi:hypothetical protein
MRNFLAYNDRLFRDSITLGTVAGACLMLGACASESGSNSEHAEKYLGLDPPERGFQIRSVGADIPPGADVEYCEVGRLPGEASDTYYVTSFEFGNGPNSHHLIVSAAIPGGSAEAALEALGVGNRVECLSADSMFGEGGFEGVGGSQQPYAEVAFPAGVGRKYQGGQLVVFDYHYLNTTAETVQARSAVNFHLTDESEIEHLARGFGFSNLTIDTPAGATGSFVGECHFKTDVNVGGLSRHTHRWGTDFSVWYSGGARDGEEIWTSNDWEHDVNYAFAEPVPMSAGEGFRIQCDYANTTDRPLRFGTSATDEMCILFGLVWEPDGGEVLGPQSCTMSWVDSAGVAHPADEAGGFPAPTAEEASLCISNYGATIDECATCQCNSCATPVINCALDADCRAILECFGSCSDSACGDTCQRVIDEHSSALGLVVQMTECVNHQCAVCDGAL